MKRSNETDKAPRGCFQRPPGSGIWWINYYKDSKQHREKAGSKSAAMKLYQKRKTEILEGRKLPTLKRTAPVVISDLVDGVVAFTENHRSARDYICKAGIIKQHKLAAMNANEVTPEDIRGFLRSHCETPATWNRYVAFLGLAYRLGIDNGKVTINNPVRIKGMHQKEPIGRLLFLSREDYAKLHAIISKRFPEHLAEFVVAVHAGMRPSEQYTVDWSQYDPSRRAIDLVKTKNGDQRTVHLNAEALAAIESLRRPHQGRTDRIFPRESRTDVYPKRKQERFDNRSWFEVAVAEAQIPRIIWYTCRHTFCSWLAMAGASTREIMEAAGHKTLSQAARYSHLSPQHTQSVVDRIVTAPAVILNMHQNMHRLRRLRTRVQG